MTSGPLVPLMTSAPSEPMIVTGAPKQVLPRARLGSSPFAGRSVHRRTRLGAANRGPGEPALRHNTIMIRHLHELFRPYQR